MKYIRGITEVQTKYQRSTDEVHPKYIRSTTEVQPKYRRSTHTADVEGIRWAGSATQWLHTDHILGTRHGPLNDREQGVAEGLDGADAGAERKQEDVEPGEEEGDGPGDVDEDEEPEDRPQDAGTQSPGPAALSLSLSLAHRLFCIGGSRRFSAGINVCGVVTFGFRCGIQK